MAHICTNSTPFICTKIRFAPNDGGMGGGGVGRERIKKKSINKCNEINKISTLTSHKNSLQDAIKIGFFYCHPWQIGFTFVMDWNGGRGLNPHTEGGSYYQKQSEMVFSAAKRTFETSKLQNCISDVNETWSRYEPPQHL